MPSLVDLGWHPFFETQLSEGDRAQLVPARVAHQSREIVRIVSDAGEWLAEVSGRLRHVAASRADLPTVGDWVLAAPRPEEGRATIHRVLARRSRFSRKTAGRVTEEQIVAANVDTVLLVSSLNLEFNVRRIERYLSLAWESGATPVVVLNKADLIEDPEPWRRDAEQASQGVAVVATSAIRGDGMDALRDVVRCGGTTALLGSSGVGKTTLINALLGTSARVHPVRADDDKGRHTTTARQLFLAPGGGVLIDTPGMRELQLWDAESGLEHAFSDVEDIAAGCRFRDCSHQSEPGCAVTQAAAEGVLPPERLESYRRLQREQAFLESRQDENARAERTRYAKQMAKALKDSYKLRDR